MLWDLCAIENKANIKNKGRTGFCKEGMGNNVDKGIGHKRR